MTYLQAGLHAPVTESDGLDLPCWGDDSSRAC